MKNVFKRNAQKQRVNSNENYGMSDSEANTITNFGGGDYLKFGSTQDANDFDGPFDSTQQVDTGRGEVLPKNSWAFKSTHSQKYLSQIKPKKKKKVHPFESSINRGHNKSKSLYNFPIQSMKLDHTSFI